MLGMWAGEGDGESAKYWLALVTEPENRWGSRHFLPDLLRLQRATDIVSAVFAATIVQTCIIHLK